jgi:N-acyl-D-amino-acid deacylase
VVRGAPEFAATLERTLTDADAAARLRRDVAHEIERRGGAENVVVFDYPDSSAIGKTLAAIAAARRLDPVDAAIRLQLEGYRGRPGGARLRGFSMAELDVEAYAAQPWVATSTDGDITLPEDGPTAHARFYGSFPRKIRRYALERGIISLEDAVRSMTSLAAQILGLRDRGLVREGHAADLVVFDPERLNDRATFAEPHRHSEGVEVVLVNGVPVLRDGRVTGALAGRVLSNH